MSNCFVGSFAKSKPSLDRHRLWVDSHPLPRKDYLLHSGGFSSPVCIMSNFKRSMLLLVVYLGSIMMVASPVSAQSPNPDVDLQCAPNVVPIDVFPGASRSGTTYCTATNPTSYAEVVRITVTAGGLTYAAPGSVTVPPSGSIDFEVTVRGELRMPEGSRQVTITAVVDTANGVANPNPTPHSVGVIVEIRQFSRLRVESTEPFKQLRPKTDYIFEFKVFNDGNARDKFNVLVVNLEDLQDNDFQVTLPSMSTEIDSLAPAMKMRVSVRTPKKQGWSDDYYQMTFQATSDFSVRTEGQPNYESQMITIYVRGVYLPGFELIPSLAMLAFAAAVGHKRYRRDDEE